MSKNPDQVILRFLSQVWFGSPGKYWDDLTADERSGLLQQITDHNLEALGYYALHDKLPEDLLKKFHEKYQRNSIYALRSQVAFAELCKFFKDKKIRFCPIKGVDLASRCYPAAALRSFCDWDVLIHPDDCLAALELLQHDGWQAVTKLDVKTAHHHFAVHCKNNFFLEPHRSLAQFNDIAPHDLWNEILPESPGSMQHVLSPELNILQLLRHASCNNYSHLPVVKLLQDAAAIIRKEQVDWQKLKLLAAKWNLPYPGDILSVWDEFFPDEIIEEFDADKNQISPYRNMFDFQNCVNNIAPGEWSLSKHKGSKILFIYRGLLGMTPNAMIKKYKLSFKGGWILLPAIYLWDITLKFFRFWSYVFFPNRKMQRYQQMVDALEDKYEK